MDGRSRHVCARGKRQIDAMAKLGVDDAAGATGVEQTVPARRAVEHDDAAIPCVK
ncbi:hypothetical protein LAUMK13_03596 [Mycobacterium innocens]|uniref:Uncharacterized protein n=1 Tax=Mycobacterium innocens TaxID=2341083 RepID=A0A498QAZ7_9MYCO|nr:hypothetical protein LAUMK13_03596 [Mycobacterium innocens]